MQNLKPNSFTFAVLVFLLFSGSVSLATKLGVDDVIGFEVLIASSCEDGFQCAFGHSLIRVNMKSGNPEDDIVLGFSTTAPEPKRLSDKISFSIKSVTGLPLRFEVTDLKTVYVNYAYKERRSILRLPIQLTKTNKETLIENINTLFFSRESQLSSAEIAKRQTAYNSLFNNCAGEIVSLLNRSGLPRELFGVALPSNLPAHLYRTYVALYPGIVTSPNLPLYPQFLSLPESYYEICETLECAMAVVSDFPKYWPGKEIDFPNYERPEHDGSRQAHSLWVRSEPTHWNKRKPIIQKHFELLRKAF